MPHPDDLTILRFQLQKNFLNLGATLLALSLQETEKITTLVRVLKTIVVIQSKIKVFKITLYSKTPRSSKNYTLLIKVEVLMRNQ